MVKIQRNVILRKMGLSFKSNINYLLKKALHKISIKYKTLCIVYSCPHCDCVMCI